jgi:hypothetical protein
MFDQSSYKRLQDGTKLTQKCPRSQQTQQQQLFLKREPLPNLLSYFLKQAMHQQAGV